MRDPRTWRPLSPFELLEAGQPPAPAAAMAQAAAAPPSTAAGRILGAVGGAAEGLATLPFLIPQALAGRLQQRIAEGRLATESLPLRIREMQLANQRAEQEARLAESQFPSQAASAAAKARQLSTLDARIGQATDPREREALIRGAAGGPFQPFDIEPTEFDKITYSTVLGIGADEAGQMIRQKNAKELAQLEQRNRLQQIAASGAQDRLTQASKPPTPLSPGDVAGLRKEYTALSKDFGTIRDAAEKIKAVAGSETPAGDMALIFNFMKILDPGSTVREGEYATAQNSPGVSEQVRSMYNRVINNERLTDERRADIVAQAGNTFQAQLRTQLETESKFSELAARLQANPADVVDIGVIPKALRSSGVATDADAPKAERRTIGGAEYEKVPGGWRLVK